MINKDLSNAAVEINSIFENMSLDLLNKIPKNFRNFFTQIASKNYKFEYDKTKKLNEQNLLPKTKGIVALIYRDYLCSNLEKEDYIKEYNKILMLNEQEKRKKYNSNDIFPAKTTEQISATTEILPIEYNKKSLFKKIVEKIKSIFY